MRERDIEGFKAALIDKGLSAKRAKNILAVLSKMLRYAREIRVFKEIPYLRVPKVPPRRMDFLTDDEYGRLYSAASSEGDRLAMLLLAGDAGLRKGEVLALEWRDLDLGAGAIVVTRSMWHDNSSDEHVDSPKGGRMRKVPMTQRLRQALLAHPQLRGRRVFCTLMTSTQFCRPRISMSPATLPVPLFGAQSTDLGTSLGTGPWQPAYSGAADSPRNGVAGVDAREALLRRLGGGILATTRRWAQVTMQISASGSQPPSRLPNITKLCTTSIATTKTRMSC